MRIQRIDPTGASAPVGVRGADRVAMSGGSFGITDFEAPIGKNFQYEAVVTSVSYTDLFNRTVSNEWGTSTSERQWTTGGGAASAFFVNGTDAGVFVGAVNNLYYGYFLTNTFNQRVRGRIQFPKIPVGGNFTGWVLGRMTDPNNYYVAQLTLNTSGRMILSLLKRVGGTLTGLSGANVDLGPWVVNSAWYVKLEVFNTSISAKAWSESATEPSGWQLSTIDTSLSAGSLAGLGVRAEAGNTDVLPQAFLWKDFQVEGPRDYYYALYENVRTGDVAIPAPSPGTVWLKSVGQPALSRRVNMVDLNDVDRPRRILGEFEVLGRSNKVVLTDTLGGREGEFTIATFPIGGAWESDSYWRDLQTLVKEGGTLLLQTAGPTVTGEDDLYLEITQLSRKRIGPVGGELVHLLTLSYIEVDRPATVQESLLLRSWQSVLDQNASWQAVLNNHTSWLDVLQRNL
ncbi:hypothetical protein [Micromonospora sp. CB01531]|uniref:hypothetical protein n=1 Tax=Micromonospora sp. CB01531 TaxID=1718947 RepID=UPI001160FEEC|nr:hypothetical protein [Micromonospora sp. CB01531]